MKITEVDETRLRLWFANAVSKAKVAEWGVYFEDQLDNPTLTPELDRVLDKHLDRGGLAEFVEHEGFLLALRHGAINQDIGTTSLVAATGGTDTFDLSKTLLDRLSSLPLGYTFYVRGPRAMSQVTRPREINIKLSDQLSLVSSSMIKNDVKFSTGINHLDEEIWRYNDIKIKKLLDRYLYFVFRSSGYVGNEGISNLVYTFFNELRSFYGACLAHNVLSPYARRGDVTPVVMGIENGSNGVITSVVSMESDLVNATYFTGFNLKSHYRKSENFAKDIEKVVAFFRCNSARLKTAATWLLRAKLSQQPIDRVLESAITLEVLLGDKIMADRVGLTKLMGNRCAYALAKSSSEREELINFFTKFYRLKSEIVHAGKFSHSSDDFEIVARGMRLASQMLVHEQAIDECST